MSKGKTVEIELPDLSGLDLTGKVREARTQLADRIDPARTPRRRARALWIGLTVAATLAGIWGYLSRRPRELAEVPPPIVPTPAATTSNGHAPAPADTPAGSGSAH